MNKILIILLFPTFLFSQSRYQLACAIIKKHEGYRAVAYQDGDRYSIGYGTKSYKGERISRWEAQLRFRRHMGKVGAEVAKLNIKDKVLYACMCDLLYNKGHIPNEIKKNLHNKRKVAHLLPKTVKKGKYRKGLLKRRNYCKKLLLNGR